MSMLDRYLLLARAEKKVTKVSFANNNGSNLLKSASNQSNFLSPQTASIDGENNPPAPKKLKCLTANHAQTKDACVNSSSASKPFRKPLASLNENSSVPAKASHKNVQIPVNHRKQLVLDKPIHVSEQNSHLTSKTGQLALNQSNNVVTSVPFDDCAFQNYHENCNEGDEYDKDFNGDDEPGTTDLDSTQFSGSNLLKSASNNLSPKKPAIDCENNPPASKKLKRFSANHAQTKDACVNSSSASEPFRKPLASLLNENRSVPAKASHKNVKIADNEGKQPALDEPESVSEQNSSLTSKTSQPAQNQSNKVVTSVSIDDSAFENCHENFSDDDEDSDGDDESDTINLDSTQLKEWFLKDVLPEGSWKYDGFDIQKKDDSNYSVSLCTSLNTESQTSDWLKKLSIKSGMDFRVRKTFPNLSQKVATFKKEYRCHNNTMAHMPSCKTKKPHYKHVKCPFLLRITIRNQNMRRSSGICLKTHPCLLEFQNVLHNHPIHASDVLRHRRPNDDVVEKFTNLFRQCHSPSSALNTHKFDLQEEFGSEYLKVSADGSRCPSLKWCYYWYRKMFSQVYGPQDGYGMIESLKTFIKEFNEECGSECSKFELTDDGQYMVVICTPLMKKVHKYVKGSSEIAFVDSGGCMDRHSSKIFLVMTPSVAGALPLGIIVTSSEAEDLLKKAFLLWKSILPENAFFGKEGPAIFMTDDCKSERNTLNYVFPHAILLLCIFHVLQAVWRWLLDSNHGVCKTDKPILYHMFKDVLNSETKEKCQENYEILKNHPASQKQSKAKDYFSKLMLRVSEWALSYRMEYLTRGHNTNNYCEATMRVLKDHIFFRTKAFSLVQLFHFLTTRIDKYFERRIAAVLNNRVENYVKSRYHIKKEKLIPLSCSQVSQNIYTVSNSESKMTYTVNTEVEICTCPVGKTGAPCKHQYAVVLQFNLSSNQFLPFSDEKAKRTLYKVISDSSVELPQEWFTVLRSGPVNPFAEPAPVSEETDEVETSPAFENGDNVIIPNADVSVDNEPSANECADVADSILDEQFQEEDENEKAERIARCLEDINRFSDTLKSKVTEDPDNFLPAVEKMMRRYNTEIKTDSAFVSALQTFNRYNSPTTIFPARTIPVHALTPGRRKYPLSGAKHPQITGRPPDKVRIVKEHGWSAPTKQPPFFVQHKSTKAPHCISQRVDSYSFM